MGDIVSAGRDESRGQVLILVGVVIALAILASAIALTVNIQASVDRAEGVSKTTTPATSMMADIDDSISTSIVEANRNDADVEALIDEQDALFSRSAAYRSHEVTVELEETIDGTRYHDSGELREGLYVSQFESLSGGIEVNAGSVPDVAGDDRMRIETDTHDMYLSSTGDGSIRAEVETSGHTEVFFSNNSHPYVDLGDGSFDGYQFRSYDQTEINNVTVQNTSGTEGTVELVTERTSTNPHPELSRDNDATFGVVYTVTVRSDRQQTTMTRMATHGPVRGESA